MMKMLWYHCRGAMVEGVWHPCGMTFLQADYTKYGRCRTEARQCWACYYLERVLAGRAICIDCGRVIHYAGADPDTAQCVQCAGIKREEKRKSYLKRRGRRKSGCRVVV